MADENSETLYAGFNFLLEIEGVTGDAKQIVGGFKSISGMDSNTEVIEFKSGWEVKPGADPKNYAWDPADNAGAANVYPANEEGA